MEVIVVGCVFGVLASFGFAWFVFLLTTVAYHDVVVDLSMDGSSFLSFEVDVDGGNVAGPGGTLNPQPLNQSWLNQPSPIRPSPITHHLNSDLSLTTSAIQPQ